MSNLEREAAEILWEDWQDGTCIKTLPEKYRPADIDAGYCSQRALVEVSKQNPVGYKIAVLHYAPRLHHLYIGVIVHPA